jgi:hypothetical protein
LNIGTIKAVSTGIKSTFTEWRLLILVYFLNFIFAALLSSPIVTVFAKDISRSLVGNTLLYGFNYQWYVEFLNTNLEILKTLIPQAILIFFAYIITEIVLAGALYSIFAGNHRATATAFISSGLRHFFPLLIIATVKCIVLYLLFVGVTHTESIFYQVGGGIGFVLLSVISDFTKAAIVIENGSFGQKVQRGVSFAVKHSISSTGVYIICASIGIAAIVLHFLLYLTIDSTNNTGVVAEIVLVQIFILLRIFSKLVFYASETIFYKENQIEVIQVRPEMLE